ncbi:hypothetical protein RJ640_001912 [Escallonia rubra]|uniref:Peptidase C1A papain C-terminal domain-containing protein n=1 Tax=Escallonia rubra TaxID=112253 RepID=A0AA88R5R0_9ASTE|nr:hypothetical protein RJ640_001912 [Escallonia rubra]
MRFGIYQSNIEYIDYINGQNLSYKLVDSEFSGMTNEEFLSIYTGLGTDLPSSEGLELTIDEDKPLATRMDQRERGAVTPVKNQGQCGKLVELVNCDVNNGNRGCNGGYMERALEFIGRNGGITTRDEYPYVGIRRPCNTVKLKNHAVTISGYATIHNNERMLHKLQLPANL